MYIHMYFIKCKSSVNEQYVNKIFYINENNYLYIFIELEPIYIILVMNNNMNLMNFLHN